MSSLSSIVTYPPSITLYPTLITLYSSTITSSPSSVAPYPSLVLIQQILTRYGYPLILVLGTLGNIFNIILFLRKALRTTCNNYFLASAFVNIVIINVGIISTLYTNDQPWAITTIYCKIRSYLFNASQQMSRFLIVTACFDRFALCSTNVHLRHFSGIHIARRLMIPLIIIIWFIIPMHILIFNTSVNNTCTYSGAVALYHSIYGITLVGFLPPTLMALFSLLTFINLKSRQQRRQVRPFIITNSNILTNEKQRKKKKDQQVFLMLIVQVVVYVSTTTITSINLLYSTLTTYMGINKSNERKSIESFVTFMTGFLNYSCPCLSFYLFLFASHLYRKQMKLVILQVCRRCYFLWTGTEHINNNNNNNNNTVINGGRSIRTVQINTRVRPDPRPIMIPNTSLMNNTQLIH